MTSHPNAQTVLGVIHAQEVLLMSLIRALPRDVQQKVSDEFHQQFELAEASHLSDGHDRETLDAFRAHIRKLSMLLASLN